MSMQVNTNGNYIELWCDASRDGNGCANIPARCYFGETTLVSDALTDILILLPNGKDSVIEKPAEITYVNEVSPFLKSYVKHYGYELPDYSEESIQDMENALQVKVVFPPHEKEFFIKTYSKYHPQLMKYISVR